MSTVPKSQEVDRRTQLEAFGYSSTFIENEILKMKYGRVVYLPKQRVNYPLYGSLAFGERRERDVIEKLAEETEKTTALTNTTILLEATIEHLKNDHREELKAATDRLDYLTSFVCQEPMNSLSNDFKNKIN